MFSLAALRHSAAASARQPLALSTLTPRWTLSVRQLTTDTEGGKEEKEQAKEPQAEEDEKETATVDPLTKELAEKNKKLAELQDAYLRCLADQENIRERSRKEVSSAKEFAIQKFAKDLLDTVDILGMALAAVPVELRENASQGSSAENKALDQLNNLYKGVSMTEAELLKTLKRHGVEQEDPLDQVFDPNRHQALFQAPMPDKEPGTVFSVQKKGYSLKGRVLRPAQVGVVADPQ
ncbi:GrpE-domain-containing protein [Spinellus fusiger]|nr:GrpE-domain-containing protein [Spinellus fusiger]